jgi:hypothetical protein
MQFAVGKAEVKTLAAGLRKKYRVAEILWIVTASAWSGTYVDKSQLLATPVAGS